MINTNGAAGTAAALRASKPTGPPADPTDIMGRLAGHDAAIASHNAVLNAHGDQLASQGDQLAANTADLAALKDAAAAPAPDVVLDAAGQVPSSAPAPEGQPTLDDMGDGGPSDDGT